MINFFIFLILLLLVLLDELKWNLVYKRKCKEHNLISNTLWIFHSLICNYIAFGSLFFGMYKVHLIFTLLIMLGWLISYLTNQDTLCVLYTIEKGYCKDEKPRKVKTSSIILTTFTLMYDIYMLGYFK